MRPYITSPAVRKPQGVKHLIGWWHHLMGWRHPWGCFPSREVARNTTENLASSLYRLSLLTCRFWINRFGFESADLGQHGSLTISSWGRFGPIWRLRGWLELVVSSIFSKNPWKHMNTKPCFQWPFWDLWMLCTAQKAAKGPRKVFPVPVIDIFHHSLHILVSLNILVMNLEQATVFYLLSETGWCGLTFFAHHMHWCRVALQDGFLVWALNIQQPSVSLRCTHISRWVW